MIVVKYFHEEPAALEILAADEAPDARGPDAPSSLEDFLSSPKYYRGYLTASELAGATGVAPAATGATDLASVTAPAGASVLTGATAVGDPGVWSVPLQSVLQRDSVRVNDGSGPRTAPLAEVLLTSPAGTVVVVGGQTGAEVPALAGEIRDHNRAIRAILDAGDVLLRAEPAHDGVDWTLYSARPLADRVTAAFQAAPSSDAVQRFVIPQRMARGEHKFYFERYDLDLFAAYRV